MLAEHEEGDTTFDVLRRALLALARDYMDRRDEVVLVQRIVHASPTAYAYERTLDREWERALETALRAGRSRTAQRRASVLAAALMGVIRATVRDWVEADGEGDLVALGASNLTFLEGALDELH